MNIFNTLRKPYFAIILASLVLFVSCTQGNTDSDSFQNRFNYTEYNSMKAIVSDLKPLNINALKSIKQNTSFHRIENNEKEQILNVINESISDEPTLQIDVLEYFELVDENQIILNAIDDGIMTDKDLLVTNQLATDIVNLGLDNALIKFEQDISTMNLSSLEFGKYEKFANQLLIVQEDMLNNGANRLAAGGGWGCAFAIASYTLATVAVGVTCVPNPTTPLACPIAIGRAILAYGSMIAACAD